MTTVSATQASDLPQKATLGRVILDQKKTELVALALMVLSVWFGQSGNWTLPACIAGGILLGAANHVATEYWLLRVITSERQVGRGEMIRATIVRLAVLAVLAVGAAVALWPDGIGLLLGLAIFRLITLVMTTIPLLKELKNQ